jgi:hypothetical protein
MNPWPPYNLDSLSRLRSYNDPAMTGPAIAAIPRLLHARLRKTGAREAGSLLEVSTASAVHTDDNPPAYN